MRRFVSTLPSERAMCGRRVGVRPGVQEARQSMHRGWTAHSKSSLFLSPLRSTLAGEETLGR
jgi:hypothetical protein